MLVLVETSESQAAQIIENIRSKIVSQPVHPAGGPTIELTVSVGICMFDGHPDFERLIKRADSALYTAKRNGRDRTDTWLP